jgi:hypothetical protein
MAKDFNTKVGGKVPKAEAKKWVKDYDDKKRKDKKNDTKSIFFGKEFLEGILKTNGATGISFYFATKYNAEVGKDIDTLVLLPTMEDGTIIWSTDPTLIEGDEYGWNDGKRCPHECPIGDAP